MEHDGTTTTVHSGVKSLQPQPLPGNLARGGNPGRKGRVTTLLLVVSLMGAGCQETPSPLPPAAQPESAKPVAARVMVVQPTIQAVRHTLKAVGSFLAEDEVTISSQVDGRIVKILVDEGHPLEVGQLVVELEQERPQLEVGRAQAEVQEARADLALQETTLKRQAELLHEQMISQQVYDNNAARAELAKARLERAEAQLRLARKALKDTTVVAPLNGIITDRHVAVGEYVKAGNELFTAIKTHPLKLSFTLPERFAAQVHREQAVSVKVKAYPDRDFSGRIYFINPQVDPQSRALQVKALVDNREGVLKPGFFADVHLLLEVNERAVVVPQEAVVRREDTTLAYVVLDGVAQERKIGVGEQFDGKVEILSGVEPHEVVVTNGNHILSDGQAVQVVNGAIPANAPAQDAEKQEAPPAARPS